MSRCWLAVFSGVLVTVIIAPAAWGQAPPRRPTFTERISAIGRSLTNGPAAPQPTAQEEPIERAGSQSAFPQVDGRALLPNGFANSRPAQSQPSQRSADVQTSPAARPTTPRNQSQSGSGGAPRQSNGLEKSLGGSVEPRAASRPRADSVSENELFLDTATLPGLGGSPLPSITPNDDPTDNGEWAADAGSTDGSIRSVNPAPAAVGSTRTRPRTAGVAPRQSPPSRSPVHVDPSDLRHELAGAFPTSDAGSAAAKGVNAPVARSPVGESNNGAAALSRKLIAAPSPSETGNEPSLRTADEVFTRSASDGAGLESVAPTASKTGTASTPIATQPISPLSTASRKPIGASKQAGSNDPNVLVANRTPVITSDIRGPKQILVGREATFRIRLQNQGDAAAEGIDVAIRVPSWADIVETTATSGTVSPTPSSEVAGTGGGLKWQISRLEPRGSETVDLRLVPRTSRPLELGVTWTLAPVGSRAVVEVQEPKLEINVSGPDEVLFGKPQLYRFTISNPGTGVAEGLKIDLFPPGGGDKAAASNSLPDLLPGKSQTIEVELVARDAGKLMIKAQASAAGDLTSVAAKEVFCRKPELSVDWRGPEMKYAGTEATYYIRVRNPGTAPADDVTVRAALPEGAQLTSASEGQVYDATRREIAWRVGSLGPGDDSYMELKCTVTTPGINQLKLEAATASGDLADKKLAETNVVALADLKLDVSDPSGPVAVGDAAVYEIRVQNRGASTARDINVVALFSAGVEPDQGDGAQYSVSNGRVAFRAIDELQVGRQVVLKIRTHAVQPGTHVFRAEVLCKDLEIKLAAEETTRFYADDAGDAERRQASNSGNGFESTPR